MACYDNLPADVRKVLNEHAVKYSPETILRMLGRHSSQTVIQMLRDAEKREISEIVRTAYGPDHPQVIK